MVWNFTEAGGLKLSILIVLLTLLHDLRVDLHTRGSSIIFIRYIWLKHNPYSDGHLITYQGTLLHNDLPDILVFTDSQIDERKGYRAANGTEKVIRGTKTPVEPKALYGQTE